MLFIELCNTHNSSQSSFRTDPRMQVIWQGSHYSTHSGYKYALMRDSALEVAAVGGNRVRAVSHYKLAFLYTGTQLSAVFKVGSKFIAVSAFKEKSYHNKTVTILHDRREFTTDSLSYTFIDYFIQIFF